MSFPPTCVRIGLVPIENLSSARIENLSSARIAGPGRRADFEIGLEMKMEAVTQITGDELVREVETAKEIFPDARVKVRRGRLIVLEENLIIFEPFAWALQHEQTDPG